MSSASPLTLWYVLICPGNEVEERSLVPTEERTATRPLSPAVRVNVAYAETISLSICSGTGFSTISSLTRPIRFRLSPGRRNQSFRRSPGCADPGRHGRGTPRRRGPAPEPGRDRKPGAVEMTEVGRFSPNLPQLVKTCFRKKSGEWFQRKRPLSRSGRSNFLHRMVDFRSHRISCADSASKIAYSSRL